MGIQSVKKDWPNIPLTDDQARLLVKIEKNPIYKDVRCVYSNRSNADYGPNDEPLSFGDICYWLEYEAGYQECEYDDGMFSKQAIASIKRWCNKHYAYPIHPYWG